MPRHDPKNTCNDRSCLRLEGVKLFKEMKRKHDIHIPKGICSNLTDKEFDIMIDVAMSLEPLWENAIGKDWKTKITRSLLKDLYSKM